MSDVGETEFAARLADIAEVKAGNMTLEEAQARARKRQRQSGLTPHEHYSKMNDAARRSRREGPRG